MKAMAPKAHGIIMPCTTPPWLNLQPHPPALPPPASMLKRKREAEEEEAALREAEAYRLAEEEAYCLAEEEAARREEEAAAQYENNLTAEDIMNLVRDGPGMAYTEVDKLGVMLNGELKKRRSLQSVWAVEVEAEDLSIPI